MLSNLKAKIDVIESTMIKMGVMLDEQAQVINGHAGVINKLNDAIDQNRIAMENVVSWVSAELGGDAVKRLADMLGYKKPEEEKSAIIT